MFLPKMSYRAYSSMQIRLSELKLQEGYTQNHFLLPL